MCAFDFILYIIVRDCLLIGCLLDQVKCEVCLKYEFVSDKRKVDFFHLHIHFHLIYSILLCKQR